VNRFNIIPITAPQEFIESLKTMIRDARGEGETRGQAVALVTEKQEDKDFEVVILNRESFDRLMCRKAHLTKIHSN
jgi:hypothetical protein